VDEMKNEYEIKNGFAEIILKRRYEKPIRTKVDIEDIEKLKKLNVRWHGLYVPRMDSYYVVAQLYVEGKFTSVLMHRYLMNPKEDKVVDHLNHDILDNRKSNLRLIKNAENLQNARGASSHNKSSGIRGVSWSKWRKKWRARLNVNRKEIIVGYFDDVKEAEKAVKKARAKHMPFSQEALTN
jgi:hypothetical protein